MVGKKGMDQSKICTQRGFEKVVVSVHFDLAFAFLDDSANAC